MKDGPLCKPHGTPLREPLRTLDEMAEEFGVPKYSLATYLGHHAGPSPVFQSRGRLSKTQTWYKPSEVRKWWREIQPILKVHA